MPSEFSGGLRRRGHCRRDRALALAPVARPSSTTPAPGKLSVSGSVFVGTAIRTDTQDPELLPNVNSSRSGSRGTP